MREETICEKWFLDVESHFFAFKNVTRGFHFEVETWHACIHSLGYYIIIHSPRNA